MTQLMRFRTPCCLLDPLQRIQMARVSFPRCLALINAKNDVGIPARTLARAPKIVSGGRALERLCKSRMRLLVAQRLSMRLFGFWLKWLGTH
jgi:hypothetical protein